MKKPTRILALVLAAAMLCGMTAGAAEPPVPSVQVNGALLEYTDAQPRYVDGELYLPLRALAEKLGAEVYWERTPNYDFALVYLHDICVVLCVTLEVMDVASLVSGKYIDEREVKCFLDEELGRIYVHTEYLYGLYEAGCMHGIDPADGTVMVADLTRMADLCTEGLSLTYMNEALAFLDRYDHGNRKLEALYEGSVGGDALSGTISALLSGDGAYEMTFDLEDGDGAAAAGRLIGSADQVGLMQGEALAGKESDPDGWHTVVDRPLRKPLTYCIYGREIEGIYLPGLLDGYSADIEDMILSRRDRWVPGAKSDWDAMLEETRAYCEARDDSFVTGDGELKTAEFLQKTDRATTTEQLRLQYRDGALAEVSIRTETVMADSGAVILTAVRADDAGRVICEVGYTDGDGADVMSARYEYLYSATDELPNRSPLGESHAYPLEPLYLANRTCVLGQQEGGFLYRGVSSEGDVICDYVEGDALYRLYSDGDLAMQQGNVVWQTSDGQNSCIVQYPEDDRALEVISIVSAQDSHIMNCREQDGKLYIHIITAEQMDLGSDQLMYVTVDYVADAESLALLSWVETEYYGSGRTRVWTVERTATETMPEEIAAKADAFGNGAETHTVTVIFDYGTEKESRTVLEAPHGTALMVWTEYDEVLCLDPEGTQEFRAYTAVTDDITIYVLFEDGE